MIVSPWIDKKVDPYKWWPIWGDDEIKGQVNKTQRERLIAKLRRLRHDEAVKNHNGKST